MATDLGFLDDLGATSINTNYEFEDSVNGIVEAWLFNLKHSGIPDKLRMKGVVSGGGQDSDLASDANIVITTVNEGVSWTLSMKDYWYYVEKGRAAGKRPPTETIQRWIKKKGISPSDVLQKMNPKSKRLPFEMALKSLSFIISRSIGKKGTIKRFQYNGTNFLNETLKEQVPALRQALETKLGQAIQIRVVTDLKGLK
jgi:hypothetical protein